jgi:pyridoxal phosphate enzyme (YggS family)
MEVIQNFLRIKNQISDLNSNTKLIAVSKGQSIDKIKLLIDSGHLDFGENKVQEAFHKWTDILNNYININLHLIGGLQSNKAKDAFKIFNYIHSLDSEKLARIFSDLENNDSKKIKYFIQVNIGDEIQKKGIKVSLVSDFVRYCQKDLKLNVLGLMCIPPANVPPDSYFLKLKQLNEDSYLKDLSMGMSEDFEIAIKLGSTYVRVGTSIFGQRSSQF